MSAFDQFLQIPSRSTLFVGDLSYFCTEEHLKRLFAPYGATVNGVPTVSAEIKRGKYGDSLMHGFVYLSSVEAADLAIQDLNNKKFMGRYMRVSWASPHIANAEPRPRETWSQVHVTFSTPFLDLFITEEFLEEIFSAFGTVADVTVKRHNRNTTIPPSHSGYAFVYYYELPPAARAVQRFTEMAEINNVRLMCNLPHVIRDKHEKPHYARTEPRGIPHMSAGPRGAPRPMGYGKPPSGHYNNYPPDSFPPRDPYFRGPGRGPSMYDIPPSRGEYSGEYEFANARKFAPPRYGGEVDVGYSSRSSEYANQMLFAGERHRPDMHPSAWPSHSSGHLSREALLTSQNSGELSLSSWSSLSHSNSLNFASNSTPIGQQQKTFGFSDSLLSSAPPGPAASSATGMKVIPPSSAEEGVTNPSSVDHTFGLNLDTLED